MQVVTIHQGKFKGGVTGWLDASGKQAPVVNATIREDATGKYIEVDGNPVVGFPKKRPAIKVYINSEQDFAVGESTMEALVQHNEAVKEAKRHQAAKTKMVNKTVRAPKADVSAQDLAKDDSEAIIASLNGPDDAVVKARIAERFECADYLVQSAADGQINGIIITGPPGVGKSTNVEQSIMKAIEQPDVVRRLQWKPKFVGDQLPPVDTTKYKEQFDLRVKWISGKVSPVGFYELLYKVSEERSVLVLDDTDCVLQDETMIGFMKIAMDTSGKPRVMTWSSAYSNRMEAPSRFVFKGTIIIITNIDFDAQSQRENSLTEHLNALMDRTYYLDLTIHSLREKYLWIEHQCRDKGILERIGLAAPQVIEVMDYFKRNILNFRHVSIRTVEKIGQLCMTHGNWQRMCAVTLFSTKSLVAVTRTMNDELANASAEAKQVEITDPNETKIVDLTAVIAAQEVEKQNVATS